MITQARLKELLDYDPDTGEFTWKDRRGEQGAGSRMSFKRAGTVHKKGYRIIGIDKKMYREHHLVLLYMDNVVLSSKQQVDHINHIRHDNRYSNLRIVTNQQNQFNNGCAKGYSKTKNDKFSAAIRLNGKAIYLGTHNTEQEARNAYLQAKAKYHII